MLSKIKLNKLPIIIAVTIFISMVFIVKPENYGDGTEYHLMNQSFVNHLSPEQRIDDNQALVKFAKQMNWRDDLFNEYRYSGYFEATNGNLYSYHFWLYSLSVLPIRVALELVGFNPLISFQVFNSLLLVLLSFFLIKSYPRNKVLIWSLSVINVSIFFLHWNHPEYWSFVLVLSSLILFSKNIILWAIFLTAVASTQNPPIIFLSILYAGFYFLRLLFENKSKKYKITKAFKLGASFLTAFLPYLFYWSNFETLNLIHKIGASDFSLISPQRVFELFFDPGLGIFVFNPILTILVFVIPFLSILNILKFYKINNLISLEILNSFDFKIIAVFVCLLVMLAFSSSTLNWNHGSAGPSRYVIWSILPISIFYTICVLQNFEHFFRLDLLKQFKTLLCISIIYSLILIILGGGLVPNGRFGNGGFNVFQRITMDLFAQFYNPSIEIFQERAICKEKNYDCKNIFVYFSKDNCKKALVKIGFENEMRKTCNSSGLLNICSDNFCYYSF